jgi:hypothetical protein
LESEFESLCVLFLLPKVNAMVQKPSLANSSARSGSWMTSYPCDYHLHLHCRLSSRWSMRNWSRRRSLQPSLGPCLGSPSSSIIAHPCACSCGHASTGTCHPSLTCAWSHPCSRPFRGSQ